MVSTRATALQPRGADLIALFGLRWIVSLSKLSKWKFTINPGNVGKPHTAYTLHTATRTECDRCGEATTRRINPVVVVVDNWKMKMKRTNSILLIKNTALASKYSLRKTKCFPFLGSLLRPLLLILSPFGGHIGLFFSLLNTGNWVINEYVQWHTQCAPIQQSTHTRKVRLTLKMFKQIRSKLNLMPEKRREEEEGKKKQNRIAEF